MTRPGSDLRRRSTTRETVEEVVIEDGVPPARRSRRDAVATEEPLEIRIAGEPPVSVAVTMRTPGSDFELAAGFLFGEGLLSRPEEIVSIRYCVGGSDEPQLYNMVQVALAPGHSFEPTSLQRNFFATSSCGVCGKASIEAIFPHRCAPILDPLRVEAATLTSLPSRLRDRQKVFDRTGGLHAAALFTPAGEPLRVREDVGRHNAMDKLIGGLWLEGRVPVRESVVLVSGRLSFELVQKAARAGVPVLAGVSAPSSLAVELAREVGMTLIGFLRGNRFNIYSAPQRII